jgi:hypothetical protein
MIRMAAHTTDGKRLILIGLDRENTKRLHDGKPIRIDGAEFGLPGWIIGIFAGETVEDMLADLKAAGVQVPS